MDEKVFDSFIEIIGILTKACEQKEEECPMVVYIRSPNEETYCIPIPSHATPIIAASIGRQIMRDFMRFSNINKFFTEEQLLEIRKLTEQLSESIEGVQYSARN